MKIALVHDYLVEYGGAERVLEALHEVWPKAPVYTAYFDPKGLGPHVKRFKNWDIRQSWARYLPFMPKMLSPYRVFAPLLFESFDFSEFDVAISSTNIYFAKGIVTKPETLHICYCHTPPRYLYGYPYATRFRNYPVIKQVSDVLNHFLRIYDYLAAQRVDYFVTNSRNTAARIRKFYRRKAEVIYPPVEIRQIGNCPAERDPASREKLEIGNSGGYFLFVSRLDYFKRADLAVEACNRLKLSLKVVGKGPEEENIKAMAGPTVEILGEVSDKKLWELYHGCKALIYPVEQEDFGIVPVEAMAAGKPVIALRSGGVMESVVEGTTGVFFDKPSVESLIEAIQRYKDTKIYKKDCIKQAEKFSKERFKREVKRFVEEKWRRWKVQ